jgi:hypothetical protein
MPNAIDVFREQRDAAEQLQARVQELSALLDHARQQVNELALNDDLRSCYGRSKTGSRARSWLSPRFDRSASRTCSGSGRV